jgi:glucose-6-phosphate isomerase
MMEIRCSATVRGAAREILGRLGEKRIVERIWERDHTVWKPGPEEITNRLGWLDSPLRMAPFLPEMERFAGALRSEGFTHALLLGMGGSSLAPEVLRKTFGVAGGFLDLAIVDSTDPDFVRYHARYLGDRKTCFIVSTKSGTTVETLSLFRFFHGKMESLVGREEAGRRFIAITDPGSSLAGLAEKTGFRATFLNDPGIGGRYSALSWFGLLPAALCGIDPGGLLDHGKKAMEACRLKGEGNPALFLGGIIGAYALRGRDKLTFILSPEISGFGAWLEQLIAESTGKEGKGILPVVGESLGNPELYGADRLFVSIRLKWEGAYGPAMKRLEERGQPLLSMEMGDLAELGGQFYLWEMATAVAGHVLGVNPFDQPDVEAAKKLAGEMAGRYRETGTLPEETPVFEKEGVLVYGESGGSSPGGILRTFLGGVPEEGYIAVQAYLDPCMETDRALSEFRKLLFLRFGKAVSIGYGPRYLHSTGQLFKGDGGKGFFVQLTADAAEDAEIPEDGTRRKAAMTFGVLEKAQALGDRRALLARGRKVLSIHLGGHPVKTLEEICGELR